MIRQARARSLEAILADVISTKDESKLEHFEGELTKAIYRVRTERFKVRQERFKRMQSSNT